MRDKLLIETLTVSGVPVALFDDGSVEAVEIGPFPFSFTGYRSLYPLPSPERPIPAVDEIIKDLEGINREKELREAEKTAEQALKQKPTADLVYDYIHLTGTTTRLIGHAYFQEWPVSERLLKTALKLIKKCVKITVPDDYIDHSAWPVDFLREKLTNAGQMGVVLERCIDAKNLYELSVSTPIDNLYSTNGTYARLFEAQLPKMPPSAATFFYGRLCAAKHTGTDIVDAEQPTPAEKPRTLKPLFIFGWKYGGDGYQQYIQFRTKTTPDDQVPSGYQKCAWWPSRKPEYATRFKSIDAVLNSFRSVNPGDENTENRIYNGFLQIFEDGPFGLRPVPKLTRQTSLFDNPPPLEIVERQPVLITTAGTAGGYSRDEAKLLAAGFSLVRYDHDNKTVQCTHDNPAKGWAPPLPFGTYAAAEKTLKSTLKTDTIIEVTLDGKVNLTNCRNQLFATGFDFYRTEGIIPGHGNVPRIKQGSKGWGTWGKYESTDELKIAWDELMKNPKALHG